MCSNFKQRIKKALECITYIPSKIRTFLSAMTMQLQNRIPGDNTMDSLILDYMWEKEVEPFGACYWDEAILADSIIFRVDGHHKSTKNVTARDTNSKKFKKVKSIMVGICGAKGLPLHPPIYSESEESKVYIEMFENILR